MQLPKVLTGDSITRLLQGAAAGAVLAMIAGFGFGGWTLGSNVDKIADAKVQTAITAALTPVCVEEFQRQADLPLKWAAYTKIETYKRDDYLRDGGFAPKVAGYSDPGREVADKCAKALDGIMAKQAAK